MWRDCLSGLPLCDIGYRYFGTKELLNPCRSSLLEVVYVIYLVWNVYSCARSVLCRLSWIGHHLTHTCTDAVYPFQHTFMSQEPSKATRLSSLPSGITDLVLMASYYTGSYRCRSERWLRFQSLSTGGADRSRTQQRLMGQFGKSSTSSTTELASKRWP